MTAWTILFLAGLLEVSWSLGLKYTNGFKNLVPSVLTVIALVLSIVLLAKATKTLPIGTAYSVWVGIGSLGATIGGVYLFKESLPVSKIFFTALLLISIVGLKLSSD